VTLTLNVHDAAPARLAPLRLTVPDPAIDVMVPPPQLPVSPFGVETTSPEGNESLNATPDKDVEALGLVIVKSSEVDPFSGMLPVPKDFEIVGAKVAAVTATLADAVLPVPPSFEVTAPLVLFLVPAVVPVTLRLKVHEALDPSVAPLKLMLPDPAAAVMVPPPQLPTSPLGVDTTSPAGSESVNPTPVNVELLGLSMVKLSEVDPFVGMLPAPNDFEIVGADTAAATHAENSEVSVVRPLTSLVAVEVITVPPERANPVLNVPWPPPSVRTVMLPRWVCPWPFPSVSQVGLEKKWSS
jgi:hypothetical protein